MTYLRPFHRLVVSGTIYGVETFSWGLSLISDGEFVSEQDETVPAPILAALETFWTTVGVASTHAKMTQVKYNRIGIDGKYQDAGHTVVHDFPVPIPGNQASPLHAPQVSLAVTLDTAVARGRAHRGRFYLPLPGAAVDTTGIIAVSAARDVANATTTLINSLNAHDTDRRVGIVSDIGTGYQNEVTAVRVGRVLDTVRSRRRSIPEQYEDAVTVLVG